MELILKEDVKGLGYKNDLVKVRPGYGRNFLIPQGMAVVANASNKKVATENERQVAHKAEKLRTDAQNLADAIGEGNLVLRAKVGESGKIFGAVTTLQLSEALKAKGHDVDRKRISFNQDVKMAGDFTATLNLHKEVKHEIKFSVAGE